MKTDEKTKESTLNYTIRMRISKSWYKRDSSLDEAVAVAFGDWENLRIGDEIPHTAEKCEVPCIQLIDLIWFAPANLAYFKPECMWLRPDELVQFAFNSIGEKTNAGHAYIIVGCETPVSTDSRDTYIQNGRVIAKMW